jgi:PAS domain S-box-containing protein
MAKILIVDDEKQIRLILARILTNADHEIIEAENAGEARDKLRTDKFEVVFSDVNMPGESGIGLAKFIMQNYPDTAVIMATIVNDPDVADGIIGLGVFGYLTKPLDPKQVLIMLSNALQRRKLEIENRSYQQNLENLVEERTIKLRKKNMALKEEIIERKRIEMELRKSEKKYRSFVENTPDSLFIINSEGKLVDVNQIACKVSGYKRKELLKLTVQNIGFTSPDKVSKTWTRLRSGKSITIEDVFKRKDGSTFPVELHIGLLATNDVPNMLASVRDISVRKQAELNLKESYSQLRLLSTHLQNIREEERKQVAREIHDEFGQVLTALRMNLKMMGRELNERMKNEEHSPFINEINSMIELTDFTFGKIKTLITKLRPEILDEIGLIAAIEWQAEKFLERNGIKYEYNSNVDEIKMEKDRPIAVFRIFQEALLNVVRHAQATEVKINILQEKDNNLLFTISDNGIGFSKEKIKDKTTFGLLGMKERAITLNGDIEIISTEGNGTVIKGKIQI